MSLASTNNRNDYTGNGTTATYNYTFRIFQEADLSLFIRNTTTDVETELTLTTDYTVTGVGDSGGGNIVLVDAGQDWIDGSSFLDSGFALAIRRILDIKQETDIRNQGDFYPEVHEDQFDKMIMIDQQQQDEINRSVRLPDSIAASEFDTTIPAAMVGTNSLALMSNATGDGFAVGPSSAEISGANASAIAAAASAAAAATSETNAGTSETNAAASESAAGISETNAAASESAASTSETNAATSETNAGTSETNAAASESAAALSASAAAASAAASSWQDVVFKTFADTPISVVAGDNGYLFVVDCTGGNVVINLPAISTLTLTNPWRVGFKKSDTSSNTVTINRNGTDTIDGGTSVVITRAEAGLSLIPDDSPTPDEWTSLTFGEVPISGAIVGDTDTQDLSNKTFIDGITLEEIATPATPAAGDRKIYPKSDGKFYHLDDGGVEREMGSGGGGLDVFDTEDFEAFTAVNASGNNAAFLGGGTLDGAFSLNTTTEMSGIQSLRYTASTASSNDYGEIKTIDLDLKQRATDIKVRLLADMSGFANDVSFIIYDKTNSAELTSALDVLTASADRAFYEFSCYIPASCAQISIGVHIPTAVNTEFFDLDDIEVSTNPFVYKNIGRENNFSARIQNNGTATIISQNGGNTPAIASVSRTSAGVVQVNLTPGMFTVVPAVTYGNGPNTTTTALSTFTYSATTSQIIVYTGNDSVSTADRDFTINLSYQGDDYGKTTENVITPQVGDDIVVLGAGNGGTAITAAVTDIDFTEVTDTGNGGGNWNGTQFTVPKTGIYNISGMVFITAATALAIRLYRDAAFDKAIGGSETSRTYHTFSHQTEFQAGEVVSLRSGSGVTLSNDTNFHHISINRVGYKSLSATPVLKTAYIKDVQTSGTAGGPSTTATTHVRILNTVEGDSEIVSLSSNQFTLGPGKYLIDASAPAVAPDQHKLRLYNTTDLSYDIEGNSLYSNASNSSGELAKLSGEIIITSPKTFELRHYITTGKASNGLGTATSQGSEVYTQVKITKLR